MGRTRHENHLSRNRACRGDGADGREQHHAGLKLQVCRTRRPRISLEGGVFSRGEGAGGTLWLGSGLETDSSRPGLGPVSTLWPGGLRPSRLPTGLAACKVRHQGWATGSGHFHGPGPHMHGSGTGLKCRRPPLCFHRVKHFNALRLQKKQNKTKQKHPFFNVIDAPSSSINGSTPMILTFFGNVILGKCVIFLAVFCGKFCFCNIIKSTF